MDLAVTVMYAPGGVRKCCWVYTSYPAATMTQSQISRSKWTDRVTDGQKVPQVPKQRPLLCGYTICYLYKCQIAADHGPLCIRVVHLGGIGLKTWTP